jgi:hypothetical protein
MDGVIGIERHNNAGIQWPPGQSTSLGANFHRFRNLGFNFTDSFLLVFAAQALVQQKYMGHGSTISAQAILTSKPASYRSVVASSSQ